MKNEYNCSEKKRWDFGYFSVFYFIRIYTLCKWMYIMYKRMTSTRTLRWIGTGNGKVECVQGHVLSWSE